MKKAVVLGGTIPHIMLINKLKERGYYVILIDYLENPPAAPYVDVHMKVSTLDKDIILSIAKKQRIDLIISVCIDQANSTACYVAEKLGLPIPYSYDVSLDVTQKDRMKHIFDKGNIKTANYIIVSKETNFDTKKLCYPLVIKPSDANSSKGVFKINTSDELKQKVCVAMDISREKKVIVEEYISGLEIAVYCIAQDGNAHILMTKDVQPMSIENRELQVGKFFVPGEKCEKILPQLQEIAQKIVTAFGLVNTPFFFQAKYNQNGIYVLECAPRVAGGTIYKLVEMYTGFDYLEAALRSFLNEPFHLQIKNNKEKYVCEFLYMHPGIFYKVVGIEEMLEKGLLDSYFPFVVSGKIINDSFNSGNRIGAAMSKGKNYKEADEKLMLAIKHIQILNEKEDNLKYDR